MDQLLNFINQQLDNDKDGFVEFPLMDLIRSWNMNNPQDIDITRKLLAFSKSTDLRYVSVLLPNGMSLIRFWRDNTTKLPQGESNEPNSN